MTEALQVRDLFDATVHDSDGEKLGDVKEVFLNDATGQPDFVEIAHGIFGAHSVLVPLRGHTLEDGKLTLAFSKDRIGDAPKIEKASHLSEADHDELYSHYGLQGVDTEMHYETD